MNFKIPAHPLCGGGCELTRDRKRIHEASAVVIMMKVMNHKDLPDPATRYSSSPLNVGMMAVGGNHALYTVISISPIYFKFAFCLFDFATAFVFSLE